MTQESYPLLPRSLLIGLGILAVVTIVGIAGFLVSGLSLADALLTTVSAITTAGFAQTGRLSPAARVFTAALIVSGVTTGMFLFSRITSFVIEGDLRGNWGRRRMSRELKDLENHFIIAGFGRVGQRVAAQLQSADVPFVVVDHNPDVIPIARERKLLHLEGDAANDSVLLAVGVKHARGLLACADSDVNNVYVTLSARSLSSDLYIVARASEASAESKLRNAGADRVVSPYSMAGNRMAHLAIQPLAADFVDVVVSGQHLGVQFEERTVNRNSALANRTIADLRSKELAGGHVLAVEKDGKLVTLVKDDLVLASGDRLLIAGTTDQLRRFDAESPPEDAVG